MFLVFLFLLDQSIIIGVWIVSEDASRTRYGVKVSYMAMPVDVIAETIRRRSSTMGITKESADRCIEEYCHLYALKVCGGDQFLLEEAPLSQYKVCTNDYINSLSVQNLDLYIFKASHFHTDKLPF